MVYQRIRQPLKSSIRTGQKMRCIFPTRRGWPVLICRRKARIGLKTPDKGVGRGQPRSSVEEKVKMPLTEERG